MAGNFVVFVFFYFVSLACNEIRACVPEGNVVNEILLAAGENETFYRICQCPGLKKGTLKWMNETKGVIEPRGPDSMPYTINYGQSVALFIPQRRVSLSGYYNCVREINGKTETIVSYKLTFYDPLRFSTTPEDQFLVLGLNSTITCNAKGISEPIISWYKQVSADEYVSISDDKKYEINAIGLTVRDVTEADEGIYKCNAKVITTGEDLDTYITVKVYTIPVIVDISISPADKTIVVNDTVSVECVAKGIPVAKYSWYKIQNESKLNGSWVQEYNKITFDSISDNDRGTYECHAENIVGYAWKRINIEVHSPPNITSFESIEAAEGDRIQIYCKAEGRPRPLIDVFFDGVDMEDDSRKGVVAKPKETETEYFLTIQKLLRTDEGSYLCNASNDVGSDIREMNLTVNYKPYFEEPEAETIYAWESNPINLTCDYQSQPQSNIEWSLQPLNNEIPPQEVNEVNRIILNPLSMKNDPQSKKNLFLKVSSDVNFGIYECEAKNHLGIAKKRFLVKRGTLPSFIEKVNISDVKATSVTFDIEGPLNAGPPLLGYTAEYDEQKKYEVISIHPNRTWALDREFKIDNLNANTTYHVKFAALNKVGTGPFSEVIIFTTPEKSAPEPLTLDNDLNASHVSPDGDMVLKLKPVENNGEEIDYIAVQYCPIIDLEEEEVDEDLCKEVVSAPTNELKINDLISNTTYRFTLLAHNSVGNSTSTTYALEIPEFLIDAKLQAPCCTLSAASIIGISLAMVVICIVLLDLLLLATLKKGMIARCCLKKNKKTKDGSVQSRDRKGLLKDTRDANEDESLKQPDGPKQYEYNRVTGIITGKHSAV